MRAGRSGVRRRAPELIVSTGEFLFSPLGRGSRRVRCFYTFEPAKTPGAETSAQAAVLGPGFVCWSTFCSLYASSRGATTAASGGGCVGRSVADGCATRWSAPRVRIGTLEMCGSGDALVEARVGNAIRRSGALCAALQAKIGEGPGLDRVRSETGRGTIPARTRRRQDTARFNHCCRCRRPMRSISEPVTFRLQGETPGDDRTVPIPPAGSAKRRGPDNFRLDWVDYAKGIGITLVVYGHLLRSAYHSSLKVPSHFFMLSDSIVYSFHMPLFFFLSGLFVENSLARRGTKKYLKDKLGAIAYPYLIWSLLQISVELLFPNHIQRSVGISNIFEIPYRPWEQFWFLYALFLMYMSYAVLSKAGRYSAIAISIAAVGLFFDPIRTHVFALDGFSEHFIFFSGGVLLSRFLINGEKPNPSIWMGVLLSLAFSVAAVFVFRWQIGLQHLPGGSHPFYFFVLAALGTASVIYISQYLATRNTLAFLKILGVNSLQIYVVHMFAVVGVRVVLLKLFKVDDLAVHIAMGMAFALVTPIILVKVSERMKLPYLFAIATSRTSAVQSPHSGPRLLDAAGALRPAQVKEGVDQWGPQAKGPDSIAS